MTLAGPAKDREVHIGISTDHQIGYITIGFSKSRPIQRDTKQDVDKGRVGDAAS